MRLCSVQKIMVRREFARAARAQMHASYVMLFLVFRAALPQLVFSSPAAARWNQVHPGGYMKHYKSARPEDFDRHDDQSFWDAVDRVASRAPPVETKMRFAETQQIYGIRFEPESLSCDVGIRPYYKPISSLSWDWMHVYLTSSGLMQYHCNEFVHDVLESGVSVGSLDEQLQAFCEQNKTFMRPRSKGFFGSRLHTPRHEHGHIKALAGEMIVVIAFLMYYSTNVVSPAGILRAECQAIEIAFLILEFLRGGRQNLARLPTHRRLVDMYHGLLLACYSPQIMKVKGHLQFHIADSAERTGYLLSCFSHERRHRLMIGTTSHFRKAGNDSSPASKFILARLLVDLEHKVRQANFASCCLLGGVRDCTHILAGFFPARRRPSTVLWSKRGRALSVPLRIGNVVIMSDDRGAESHGRVKLLCEATFPDTFSPEVYVLVGFMEPVRETIFRESGVVDFVKAQHVVSVQCVVEQESGAKILFRA